MEKESGMAISVAIAVNPHRYEVTDLICSDCREKIIRKIHEKHIKGVENV